MSKVTLDIVRRVLSAGVEENEISFSEIPDEEFLKLKLVEDLQVDSFELVIFQMEIEKECNNIGLIDIPDDQFRKVKTVKDFIDLCNNKKL